MNKTLLALAVVAASGAAFAASTAKDTGTTVDPFAKSLGQKPEASFLAAGVEKAGVTKLLAKSDKPAAAKGITTSQKIAARGLQVAKKQDPARGERAS